MFQAVHPVSIAAAFSAGVDDVSAVSGTTAADALCFPRQVGANIFGKSFTTRE